MENFKLMLKVSHKLDFCPVKQSTKVYFASLILV